MNVAIQEKIRQAESLYAENSIVPGIPANNHLIQHIGVIRQSLLTRKFHELILLHMQGARL